MGVFFRTLLIGWAALITVDPRLSAVAAPERKPGAPMKLGKWVGYLKPEGSADAIALTMDSFLVQPDNKKEFPRLNMLFKLGLGGYFGPEYETEIFEVTENDYYEGVLTLDHPHNEMVITASVYATPRTQMEGQVFFHSTPISATFFLEYQTDEPGGAPAKPPVLAPSLAGQYEGSCGSERAVLQIETAKGVTELVPALATGLNHYKITGALGMENGECSQVNADGRPVWCVDHGFSSAIYDFLQGKLYLSGMQQTEECTRNRDEFTCLMRVVVKDPEKKTRVAQTCRFRKTQSGTTAFKMSRRRFHVVPTEEQKKPLPKSQFPASKALVAAARGSFFGYLHHEQLDRYQPIRLNVIASASTDNLHIENNVFVSVTSVMYFGRGLSSDFWAQQFDRRVLYLVPGYTLGSGQSDAFLQITQWTQGFISGVWYSDGFGRVGTFEVVKGSELPPLSSEARMIEGITGRYRGPEERSQGGREYWDSRLLVPRQARSRDKGYVLFQGNYNLFAGGHAWATEKIMQGSYDVYTGALAWLTENNAGGESKLVTGFIDGTDGLKLFWPNERAWPVSVLDHAWGTHRRIDP